MFSTAIWQPWRSSRIKQTYPFTLAAVKQAHLDFEQVGNQGKRVIVFDQETAGFIVSGRAYPSSY
ncbi:hypothetical protein [Lactiplantibacillus plantarum]|uniref:hypothetical protein n=1 Tax=Lactiplantibacillus plantarum TaxID=1590 RepID=UPI000930AF52|nr:hypothetical protein [Lactiplantibacillus plantarum]MDN7043964.1 hypothetical protein [Lactiplantibacillus plantarum]